MIVQQLRNLGINSTVLQGLGFGSIVGSIAIWNLRRINGDSAHAERFGIFIGLWAPTFLILANEVSALEKAEAATTSPSVTSPDA
jgi:multisubunit Na+/H+ antiporter MnhE subunit